MNEDQDEIDKLPEENAWDSPEGWLSPKTDPAFLRGCRYERHSSGQWSFWVGDVRWGFRLRPMRGLFRKGEVIVEIRQVRCLDDAVLFALGYEQGTQDMAAERKESLS